MPSGQVEPAVIPLTIMKGDDFCQPMQLVDEDTGVPLDFTGATIASQIRDSQEVDGKLIVDFTINVIDLSIASFELILSDTETRNISQKTGDYSVKVVDVSDIDTTYIVGQTTFTTNSTKKP